MTNQKLPGPPTSNVAKLLVNSFSDLPPSIRHRVGSHGDLQHSEFSMVEASPKWPAASEKTSLLLDKQSSGQSPRELYHGSPHSHYSSSVASDYIMKSPPLAVWIVPALLCALAYAFYNSKSYVFTTV
jgi:hypothetical protein